MRRTLTPQAAQALQANWTAAIKAIEEYQATGSITTEAKTELDQTATKAHQELHRARTGG